MSPLDTPTALTARLRAAVVEHLAGADEFAEPNAVRVIDGGRCDIADAVDKELMKRTTGLCLVVTLSRLEPLEVSPMGLRSTVSVMVYERPSLNWSAKGRQMPVEEAVEAVLLRLGWTEGTPGWSPDAVWSRFEFRGAAIIIASTNLVGMEATFATETHLQVAPSED